MHLLNYLLNGLDKDTDPKRILGIRLASLSEAERMTLTETLYDIFTYLDEDVCFTTPLHKIMSALPDVYFERIRDPTLIFEKVSLTIRHLHLIDELC